MPGLKDRMFFIAEIYRIVSQKQLPDNSASGDKLGAGGGKAITIGPTTDSAKPSGGNSCCSK